MTAMARAWTGHGYDADDRDATPVSARAPRRRIEDPLRHHPRLERPGRPSPRWSEAPGSRPAPATSPPSSGRSSPGRPRSTQRPSRPWPRPSSPPGMQIRALVRAVFLHPDFRTPATRTGLVRSPVEWIAATHEGPGPAGRRSCTRSGTSSGAARSSTPRPTSAAGGPTKAGSPPPRPGAGPPSPPTCRWKAGRRRASSPATATWLRPMRSSGPSTASASTTPHRSPGPALEAFVAREQAARRRLGGRRPAWWPSPCSPPTSRWREDRRGRPRARRDPGPLSTPAAAIPGQVHRRPFLQGALAAGAGAALVPVVGRPPGRRRNPHRGPRRGPGGAPARRRQRRPQPGLPHRRPPRLTAATARPGATSQ